RRFVEEADQLAVRDSRNTVRASERDQFSTTIARFRGIGTGPRVGEHESAHAVRVPAPELERDVSTDREPDDHRAPNSDGIEHFGDVICITIDAERLGRWRVAES